jgi:O-antigen/teichoic acid export membrane protein
MLVAKDLGKENYGKFVILQSTLIVISLIAGFGINTIASRYTAEYKSNELSKLLHLLRVCKLFILYFGISTALITILLSNWISLHIFKSPDLKIPVMIIGFTALFVAIDSFQKSVLVGLEAMKQFSKGTVLGAFLTLPILIILTQTHGLIGSTAGLLLGSITQCVISKCLMQQELEKIATPEICHDGGVKIKHILSLSIPSFLSNIVVPPAHWIAQILVSGTSGGYQQVAVLGIAMQWFNVIMFIPGTTGRILLPILSETLSKGARDNSKKVLLLSIATNALSTFPIFILITLFSKYIMSLYGDSFSNETLALILSVSTATILSWITPIGALVIATSRFWLGAMMNLLWATIYISLSFKLREFGAAGIMCSLLIAYAAHSIWTILFYFHTYNIKKIKLT